MSASPHLLLTRPRPQSERFAESLRAELPGLRVTIAPLMAIVLDPPAPGAAEGIAGVIFTSENGGAGFAAGCARRDLPVWCVGPRTARAAREAGFAEVHEGGGDARALIATLLDQRPEGPLLHARGSHAAADISGALRDAGIGARDLVVYDQRAQPLPPEGAALLAGAGDVVVPVFSPRSARLLAEHLPPDGNGARLHLIAISAAAAQPLAGHDAIHAQHIVSAPDARAMHSMVAKVMRALEAQDNPR